MDAIMNWAVMRCFTHDDTDAFYSYCTKMTGRRLERSRANCANLAYRIFLLCALLPHDECDPIKIDTLLTLMHDLKGVKIYHDASSALAMLKQGQRPGVKRIADRVRMYSKHRGVAAIQLDTDGWHALLQ